MATDTRVAPAQPDTGAAAGSSDLDADRRRKTRAALLSTTGIGVLLAVVFWPQFFSAIGYADDEGSFLVAMREFLKHGSLYVHTGSPYGPFYFTFVGLLYKVTGQQPTLFNSRLFAVIITSVEAGVLAAVVYRVTHSKLFAGLCQVLAFFTLVRGITIVALHPAPVIVLLLGVLAYTLVSYSVRRRTSLLVIAGAAVAGIGLCKANVGVAAAAAVLASFIIGNRRCVAILQYVVWAGVLALPFVIVYQRIQLESVALFAAFVSLTMLATGAVLRADTVSLPGRTIGMVALGAVGLGAVSLVWPIATGTTPHAVVTGVVLSPLRQTDTLFFRPLISTGWFAVVLTALAVLAAVARRNVSAPGRLFGNKLLPYVLLALASVWLIGLGQLAKFGGWLPAIAILPALAWVAAAPPAVRMALRFLVPLAALQILHAYPVAGAQKTWGTVMMFAPCAIGAAIGLGHIPTWRNANRFAHIGAVVALCIAFMLMAGLWPWADWKRYVNSEPLNLPGSQLVRLSKPVVDQMHELTDKVKANCDTFYSAPGFDSLYIWTGLEPPTGLLRNWPGAHKRAEQKEIAADLDKAVASGKRLCIVRYDPRTPEWLASTYGKGPLGQALAPYQKRVAKVNGYSVSIKGP